MKMKLSKKYIFIFVITLWLLSFFMPKPVNLKYFGATHVVYSNDILSFMVITGDTLTKGIIGYKVNVVNGNEVNITLYEQVLTLSDKHRYSDIILDLRRYDVKTINIIGAFGQKKQIWPIVKKTNPTETTPTPP